MTLEANNISVVMLGASGAVGTEALNSLLQLKNIQQITLLGRNPIPNITAGNVQQHKIDVGDASSYQSFVQNSRSQTFRITGFRRY